MNKNKAQSEGWKWISKTVQIISLLAITGCSGPAANVKHLNLGSDSELTIISGLTNRLVTSMQMAKTLPMAKVVVNDPVYKKVKRYEGFWLEDVLRLSGIGFTGDSTLVFSSLDGYQARLNDISEPDAKPLVAIRDLDNASGWEFLINGKQRLTPGPFYLVWQVKAKTNTLAMKLPWPYQISKIEVRGSEEAQRRLLPIGTAVRSDVSRGFSLFTKSCITCHSVNLEGGVLGPELNVPKNITEYRDWPYLVEFIKDPSSFRAKSKMPSFKNTLTDVEIDQVLNYLWWMRDHKVLPQ